MNGLGVISELWKDAQLLDRLDNGGHDPSEALLYMPRAH